MKTEARNKLNALAVCLMLISAMLMWASCWMTVKLTEKTLDEMVFIPLPEKKIVAHLHLVIHATNSMPVLQMNVSLPTELGKAQYIVPTYTSAPTCQATNIRIYSTHR